MKYPEFKVGVRCFTYNQADYIIDALNGFTMQVTNFPFVCCIVDDASTDGEQNVVGKYLSDNFDIDGGCSFVRDYEDAAVHYVRHRTNTNCYFVVLFLKHNLFKETEKKIAMVDEWLDLCDYEGFCEGDDYWTDKDKLQLQVDILDNHPECSLTYHACKNIFVDGFCGYTGRFCEHVNTSYSTEDILTGYHFHTATILFRRSLKHDETTKRILSIMGYDVVQYFCASMMGSLIGVNKQMSVYRRNNNGISNAIHKGDNLAYFFDNWCKIAECCNKYYKYLVHKTRVTQYLRELYETDKSMFRDRWEKEFATYPYYAIRLYFVMAHKNTRAILYNIKKSLVG